MTARIAQAVYKSHSEGQGTVSLQVEKEDLVFGRELAKERGLGLSNLFSESKDTKIDRAACLQEKFFAADCNKNRATAAGTRAPSTRSFMLDPSLGARCVPLFVKRGRP